MPKSFKTITRAVIPAAGLGTRFLPATKATPKEMLPIVVLAPGCNDPYWLFSSAF